MRILILGAGKMGSFFLDLLSFEHETAVFEKQPERLRFTYNTLRFTSLKEIEEFKPELVINAVTVKYTIPAFEEVMPYLPADCVISDISSVKTGLKDVGKDCLIKNESRECYNNKRRRLYGADILQRLVWKIRIKYL